MVYNRTMKHNEENVIVENVLTEDEISVLYSVIDNPSSKYVMKLFAQTVSDFELPNSVAKKIIDYSEKISGESGLEIAEYQFARYRNVVDPESGEILLPNLTPHWDAAFAEPRFTFDYQLGGNASWTLVVENKDFTLNNNSALTFSGTHQIHWRKKKIFSDSDYIDMVFFHLRKKKAQPYDTELPKEMEERAKYYFQKYEEE
jgi:hypothetical protein